MTATTVVINSTFAHLNDDRSMRIKQQTSSVEKEAVVTVTIGSTVTYTTGGIVIDFSQIRNWKTVYYCDIIMNSYVLPVVYIPSTNNVSSTGKFKFYDNTGTELAPGSTAAESTVITCLIRGY